MRFSLWNQTFGRCLLWEFLQTYKNIHIYTSTYEYEWASPALSVSLAVFSIFARLCRLIESYVVVVSEEPACLLCLSNSSRSFFCVSIDYTIAVCLLVFWCVSHPVPLIFITRSYAALHFNEMLVIKRWLFSVCLQTKQFVHALKDELVKSALLALHAARPGYVSKSQSSAPSSPAPAAADPHPSAAQEPHSVCNNVDGSQTPLRESRASPVRSDSIPHHKEYDEEEWASASLHAIMHH